jgi:5-methyltetrahydrofolate--homocysteine methyltransferase
MVSTEKFYNLLSQGKMDEVKKLTQDMLDEGESPEVILNQGLISAMEQIGARFKKGDIYIPEVLIAARAMHAGMAILKPILSKSNSPMAGKIVMGTVKGDLHDIGKNLVIMMLEGGGFEVVDLGVDVPVEKFLRAVNEHHPQVVAMSALLTTTLTEMKKTLDALKQAGLKGRVKTLVGGAPVTERFAQEIGADGYAPDAASAVDKAKQLIAEGSH